MDTLSMENFQAIDNGLFKKSQEAALTVKNNGITFNSACLAGMEGTCYVKLFLDSKSYRLIALACDEKTPGALRWCNVHNERRRPRKLSGDFADLLYEMMGWDIRYRYIITANKIEIEGRDAYLFELTKSDHIEDHRIQKLIGLMNRISNRKSQEAENNRENSPEQNANSAYDSPERDDSAQTSTMCAITSVIKNILGESLLEFLTKSQSIILDCQGQTVPL